MVCPNCNTPMMQLMLHRSYSRIIYHFLFTTGTSAGKTAINTAGSEAGNTAGMTASVPCKVNVLHTRHASSLGLGHQRRHCYLYVYHHQALCTLCMLHTHRMLRRHHCCKERRIRTAAPPRRATSTVLHVRSCRVANACTALPYFYQPSLAQATPPDPPPAPSQLISRRTATV